MSYDVQRICEEFNRSPEEGWNHLVKLKKQSITAKDLIPEHTSWTFWGGPNALSNLLTALARRWPEPPYTVAQSVIAPRLGTSFALSPIEDQETMQKQLLECAKLPENHHWLLWLWTDYLGIQWKKQRTNQLGRAIRNGLKKPNQFLHYISTNKRWDHQKLEIRDWEWLAEDPELIHSLAQSKNAGGKTPAGAALEVRRQSGLVFLACIHRGLWAGLSRAQVKKYPGWDQLDEAIRNPGPPADTLLNQLKLWPWWHAKNPFFCTGWDIESASKTTGDWKWPNANKENPRSVEVGGWTLHFTDEILALNQKKIVTGIRIGKSSCMLDYENLSYRQIYHWLHQKHIRVINVRFRNTPEKAQEYDGNEWRYCLLLTSLFDSGLTQERIGEAIAAWEPEYMDARARRYLKLKVKLLELEGLHIKNIRPLKTLLTATKKHIPEYTLEEETLAELL